MKKIPALIAILIFAGCVQTTSKLRLGETVLALPKDLQIQKFELTITNGTNVLSFKGEGLNSKNNPELLKARSSGVGTIIDAGGNVLGTISKDVVEGIK